jgi:hypothetical protein
MALIPRQAVVPPVANPVAATEANLHGLGIFWVVFASTWTLIVLAGMIFLCAHRSAPSLRIRGLPLFFAAVVLLHMYWTLVQLWYVIGGLAPEVVEFWVMSVLYPCGIGLFQAANSQFLHVAKAQARFLRHGGATPVDQRKGLLGKIGRMEYTRRMLLFVGLGMVVQVSQGTQRRSVRHLE